MSRLAPILARRSRMPAMPMPSTKDPAPFPLSHTFRIISPGRWAREIVILEALPWRKELIRLSWTMW